MIPNILDVIFIRAAESVVSERVQQYLAKEYGHTRVNDSSESSESSSEYYEEDTDEDEGSESSDHDDVYATYATV